MRCFFFSFRANFQSQPPGPILVLGVFVFNNIFPGVNHLPKFFCHESHIIEILSFIVRLESCQGLNPVPMARWPLNIWIFALTILNEISCDQWPVIGALTESKCGENCMVQFEPNALTPFSHLAQSHLKISGTKFPLHRQFSRCFIYFQLEIFL